MSNREETRLLGQVERAGLLFQGQQGFLDSVVNSKWERYLYQVAFN